jgi:hypothetical protein
MELVNQACAAAVVLASFAQARNGQPASYMEVLMAPYQQVSEATAVLWCWSCGAVCGVSGLCLLVAMPAAYESRHLAVNVVRIRHISSITCLCYVGLHRVRKGTGHMLFLFAVPFSSPAVRHGSNSHQGNSGWSLLLG